MGSTKTFTMIKPDAVAAGNSGAIIKIIEARGFVINAMKLTQLTAAQAGQFYEIHKEKPFYNDLVGYMSGGPIIPMILEKENAVEKRESKKTREERIKEGEKEREKKI